jgi:hypothetical protein
MQVVEIHRRPFEVYASLKSLKCLTFSVFSRSIPGNTAPFWNPPGRIVGYTLEMLHEWALHDLGHVRQIAELVRAEVRRERVRWGRSYELKP